MNNCIGDRLGNGNPEGMNDIFGDIMTFGDGINIAMHMLQTLQIRLILEVICFRILILIGKIYDQSGVIVDSLGFSFAAKIINLRFDITAEPICIQVDIIPEKSLQTPQAVKFIIFVDRLDKTIGIAEYPIPRSDLDTDCFIFGACELPD